MTQENLAEQARRGNVEAIAAIVNLQLQLNPQFKDLGIVATLSLSQDCLLVTLWTPQILERETLVAQIRKTMTALAVPVIARVQVYAIQQGQMTPAWSDEFRLQEAPEPPSAEVQVPTPLAELRSPQPQQTRSQGAQPLQSNGAQARGSNTQTNTRRNFFKYFVFGLLGFLGVAISSAFIPGSPVNRFVAWFLCAVFSFDVMCASLLPSSLASNTVCNLKLETSSSQPAKEIIVKGVPSNFTKVYAGVWTASFQAKVLPTLARRLDNGDVAVLTPLHPTKIASGGNVQLLITSDSAICSPISLKIEPLTYNAEASKQLVTGIDNLFQKFVEGLNLDRQQLSSPKDLPEELLPLSLAQWLLDNPQNQNSLKSIFSGTAPILEGEKFDPSLLGGLIANSGLNQALEKLINRIDNVTPSNAKSIQTETITAFNSQVPTYKAQLMSFTLDAKAQTEQYIAGFSLFKYANGCLPKAVKDSKTLSDCMEAQKEWQYVRDSGEFKTFTYLISGIMFLVGLIPGLQAFLVGALAGGSLANTIVQILVDFNVDLLPSKLTKIEFTVQSPISKGQTGTWENVFLYAESNEFKLTLDNVLNIILFALKSRIPPVFGEVTEFIADVTLNLKAIITPWFELAGIPLKKAEIGGTINKYKVTAKDALTPTVVGRDVISVNFKLKNYTGLKRGEAQIALATDKNLFAGHSQIISKDQTVIVTEDERNNQNKNPPPPPPAQHNKNPNNQSQGRVLESFGLGQLIRDYCPTLFPAGYGYFHPYAEPGVAGCLANGKDRQVLKVPYKVQISTSQLATWCKKALLRDPGKKAYWNLPVKIEQDKNNGWWCKVLEAGSQENFSDSPPPPARQDRKPLW